MISYYLQMRIANLCLITGLETMVRNFVDGKNFVLGYGAYEKKKGILSHMISYDTFFIAMQYMGFALKGKTVYGCGGVIWHTGKRCFLI